MRSSAHTAVVQDDNYTSESAPSIPLTRVAHSALSNEHDAPMMWEGLMRYRPVRVLPADWDEVRDFVLGAVMAYRPATERLALELASTVALYVLWATKEKFAPLDKDDLFYPGLMNQFIRSRTNSAGSYRTLHSRLFRVAEAVSGTEHRPSGYKHRGRFTKLVNPYTPRELAELESWARTQDRPTKRRHAHIVLGLMGGAGLWTGEALGIRGENLARTDSGWTVHVATGGNRRAVPVRDDWAYYLDEYSDTYVDGDYVLFPKGTEMGRATSLKDMYRGEHPMPDPQRLRDSWIRDALTSLPLSAVMYAAGTGIIALRRFLPQLTIDSADAYDAALRNPTGTRLVTEKATRSQTSWEVGYAHRRFAEDASPNALLTDINTCPQSELLDGERKQYSVDTERRRNRTAPATSRHTHRRSDTGEVR